MGTFLIGMVFVGIVLYIWEQCIQEKSRRDAYQQSRIDYYNKTGYWI